MDGGASSAQRDQPSGGVVRPAVAARAIDAVNGLLGLALLIALLGIANTLARSVLEWTREIGPLRAVGMRRGQTRQMVLAESVMVAVFGAAMGVGLGIAFDVLRAIASD